MTVVILAAGQGTRLQPYTLDRPKCLVPLDGTPLLDYHLRMLDRAGVHDVVLVTGFCADALADYAVRRAHNPDYATTNMVHSLFCATLNPDEDLYVAYADIIYSPEVFRRVAAAPGPVAVAVDMEWETLWRLRFDDPLVDAETLRMDEEGCITDIGQRPAVLTDIQAQYIGLMKFTPPGVRALQSAWAAARDMEARGEMPFDGARPRAQAYMTDMLQQLIRDGIPVRGVPIHGQWCEVDTTEDLARYQAVLAGSEPNPHLDFLRESA